MHIHYLHMQPLSPKGLFCCAPFIVTTAGLYTCPCKLLTRVEGHTCLLSELPHDSPLSHAHAGSSPHEGPDAANPGQQPAVKYIDNPFDHEAVELICAIEGQMQQRLLARHAAPASVASSMPNAAQALELQQARQLIAQLQR